ncbi:MAG TPA: Coenzyme F420 hydrogenase/dehydrogenase, beta subunit C-terminal domain [Anaerolineae bacterium]|nr:Coenzyme F420 hydrogenase/dehydrogenase, beta subunit C-terminal domain [Anaerolineae bacterium]
MSKRMEREVWALDRCAGCGLCVSTCSKGMLHWDEEAKHPTREVRQKRIGLTEIPLDTCSFCQVFCEETCPRLHEWEGLPARRTVSARAKGPVENGDPMDVIRALLIANLSAGAIDGVIANDVDDWTLEPRARLMTRVEELADSLGVQGLWVPTLDILNEAVYVKKLSKVAVVGTPCVSEGLRTLRASENDRLNPYKEALRLSIAVFCTGAYYPGEVRRFLEEKMGVSGREVKRVCISPRAKEMSVILWDGSTKSVPLSKIEGFTRSGCAVCDDYLGESADIAVGRVGAKDGYSTVIARTETGEECLRNAVDLGLLETVEEVDEKALRAVKEEKERRDRAQAFDDLMLMMLDALREPQKRAEVRNEFVRLYEVESVAECVKEGTSHGGCALCSGC